jgi:FAD/FMN-containing dehydrogenase
MILIKGQLNLYFSWFKERDDDFWHAQMRASIERLKQVAIEDGIYDDSFTQYPNYALAPAAAADLYGKDNAARLVDIRRRIDPDGIMNMTGGFEF